MVKEKNSRTLPLVSYGCFFRSVSVFYMLNFSSFSLSLTVTRALLIGLLFLALRFSAMAQAPAWQSARAVAEATVTPEWQSLAHSEVRATAVDAAGNVYVAGAFTNTVRLGSITLTSLGNRDIFVAKFNPASNQFVWAQRAGGAGADFANALAVSGTSVYVAGIFNGATADFGATTLTRAGDFDVVVAKLTDAGSFVWAQRAGGTGADRAEALAVSGTSVYVAGSFNGATADFGATTLTNTNSNTNTYTDVFVAKLTDAGTTGSFVWAQQAGGTGRDYATALAVSGTSVYVAGTFDGPTASFGATILTNTNSNANTYTDVFVAKLTDAGSIGSFAWAQQAGGTGGDYAYALAVSGTSVYVAGDFSSSSASFGATALTTGIFDAFVAKLTDAGSTGSFVWAQQTSGTGGGEQAYALAVSGTSVYVAGIFNGATVNFGASTLTNADPGAYNEFTHDAFVAKLTDAGTFAWAQRAGGTGRDYATALAVSGTSVYVAGNFSSFKADFGSATISNPYTTTSLGFLASLSDATPTATTAVGPRGPGALFPNPAHHTATLRLAAGAARTPLTLTDALGRAVRQYPAPAGAEAALDLRGLPAGLYLLRGAGPAQRLLVE
jgi:hypothetical protein